MTREPHSLEYTALLKDGKVLHYTCNPPSQEVLDSYRITCIGKDLGCRDNREVLIISPDVFEDRGIPIPKNNEVLKINSENLLRIIEKSL